MITTFLGKKYLKTLKEVNINYLDCLPLQEFRKQLSLHDGAPHYSLKVNQFLDDTFDRQIANNGPFQCPPGSLNITPLDFFMGLHKNEVYPHSLTTKEYCELRVRNDSILSLQQ